MTSSPSPPPYSSPPSSPRASSPLLPSKPRQSAPPPRTRRRPPLVALGLGLAALLFLARYWLFMGSSHSRHSKHSAATGQQAYMIHGQQPFQGGQPPHPGPPPPVPPHPSQGQGQPPQQHPGAGKKHVGYFVNWGIYGRKFPPQKIPHQHLTHINYAFGNVNKETGEVALSDTWADVEIHYEGDSWNDVGTNMYGCLKAIYLQKKQNRNLKILLSIGGWTYSPNFENIARPAWRQKFVESGVRLVEDLGLDGLDIDYEYPKTASDAHGYVALLHELRAGLEHLAQSKGRPQGQYQLTVAAPCGREQVNVLRIQEMDQVLDFWNLMAYDFAGSWDSVSGHQAGLYTDNPHGNSVDGAVRMYLNAGVPAHKLVIGMPIYGRAFMGTGGPGQPYNGVGEGSWEKGMWDYKDLPQQGAEVINDHRLGASYSFDRSKGLLISYDTPEIATQKSHYINQMGLGGAMWWELDADKPEDTGAALVRTVREQLGQLEWRENELSYPGSKYDNLRNGMQ